jgi:transposase InsO family protein
LYRYLNGNTSNLRWVLPKGARWQICKLNYDEIRHLGLEKTLDRIKKNYWFAKMSRFVKKYVNACINCAYAKKNNNSKEGLLHPINKVALPFHTLHMDHLGPFVRSKRGNFYLLVVVDAFTKFVFIKPVRNTNTLNVIRVLDEIFYTFRVPDRLISDRGSCFTSKAFKKYCYDKGIRHVLNAVASTKSNGQVERYNRTILSSLTVQNLKNDEREWDYQLGKIQWGFSNTVQKTTGRKPAEVLFGTLINSEVLPTLNDALVEAREKSDVSEIRREVKERLDIEQEKQKQFYNRNRRPARIYNFILFYLFI